MENEKEEPVLCELVTATDDALIVKLIDDDEPPLDDDE